MNQQIKNKITLKSNDYHMIVKCTIRNLEAKLKTKTNIRLQLQWVFWHKLFIKKIYTYNKVITLKATSLLVYVR